MGKGQNRGTPNPTPPPTPPQDPQAAKETSPQTQSAETQTVPTQVQFNVDSGQEDDDDFVSADEDSSLPDQHAVLTDDDLSSFVEGLASCKTFYNFEFHEGDNYNSGSRKLINKHKRTVTRCQ